jgi:hypothetical protein
MAIKTLDVADLYNEISDLARDQGVNTKALWDELVDEVIEAHLDIGEIDLEQDTETMKETLDEQWTIYKEESAISGGLPAIDDEIVDSAHEENDDVVGTGVVKDDEEEEEDDYGDGKEKM